MPTFNGNSGRNTIIAGAGDDVINARAGDDFAYGGFGNDTIDGADGDDKLWGEDGDDVITGGRGVDELRGGEGDDYLNGGNDGDFLWGNNGADTLLGGGGDDVLEGGAGADVINGGSGYDNAVYNSQTAAISVNLALGTVTAVDGIDTLIGIERVQGTNFDDFFIGDAKTNRFDGYDGHDTFIATKGGDSYYGYSGTDTVSFAQTAAVTSSGTGRYFIAGDTGFTTISDVENVIGSNFNDTLIGDGEANVLTGGLGADQLRGGDGDDRLVSDHGSDQLTGDAGADTFVVGASLGDRTIVDFVQGVDTIDMTAFGFDQAGVSVDWTASAAAVGADVVLTLTNLNSDVVNITVCNAAATGLTASDFIGGSSALEVAPPGPVGNGVADVFVIEPQTSGNITINGFEDGLDQIDLITSMGFDQNLESTYWTPDFFGDASATVFRFWGQGGESFTVTVTGWDVASVDGSDFFGFI